METDFATVWSQGGECASNNPVTYSIIRTYRKQAGSLAQRDLPFTTTARCCCCFGSMTTADKIQNLPKGDTPKARPGCAQLFAFKGIMELGSRHFPSPALIYLARTEISPITA